MPPNLPQPAPWQQDDDLLAGVDPKFGAKLLPGHRGLDDPRQRVPDIRRPNAMAREKLLLEGEDAEKAIDRRPQHFHPPLPPGPRLRSDQVYHRNPLPPQKLSEPQVEIRRVRQ